MNKISNALQADYPELVKVWGNSVKATHHFLNKDDFQLIKQSLAKDYFPAVDLYLIRGNRNKVTGFIGVAGNKLEMLFVDANKRGQGIGKLLLNYAIVNLGIDEVDVNEQNEQAVGFYKKQGFEVVKRNEFDAQGKPYPILEMKLEVK
ncbi:acetyltransferase [Paludibacter sp. 221]|uniref:acetyltransferase n=1 Tax=Paludibacter sp. 221 TaxID=2302939 RepID=UPI0013D7D712|nr:acetyltransferase [Paludibacter sp. 221]NDV46612.1 acetyltransferase [Paludibacter sp. 221]